MGTGVDGGQLAGELLVDDLHFVVVPLSEPTNSLQPCQMACQPLAEPQLREICPSSRAGEGSLVE